MQRDFQSDELAQVLESIAKSLQALAITAAPALEAVGKAIAAISPPIGEYAPLVLEFARQNREWTHAKEVLAKAGWVPHYTNPGDIEELGEDVEAIQCRLLKYYEENWQSVRTEIELRLAEYRIDEEAKATFDEALSAHEAGLYRCVCRVLFPEIERLLRTQVPTGGMNEVIEQVINESPSLAEWAPNGLREFAIFELLVKSLKEYEGIYAKHERMEGPHRSPLYGLFVNVWTDEQKDQVRRDPVPNRHAAMHGLVVYSSPLNSLNMIFVADYIFQVLSSLNSKKPPLPTALDKTVP